MILRHAAVGLRWSTYLFISVQLPVVFHQVGVVDMVVVDVQAVSQVLVSRQIEHVGLQFTVIVSESQVK